MAEENRLFKDYSFMSKEELMELIAKLESENANLKVEIAHINKSNEQKQGKKTHDFATYLYNYPKENE